MLCVCLVCEQTQILYRYFLRGRCIFCSTTEYQSWSNLPRLRYSLALEHRTEHGVVVESNPRKANVWSHEIVENSGSVFRSKKQRFHKSGIGTRFWEQFRIWESELQNLHDCIHENPRVFFVVKSFPKQRFSVVSWAKAMQNPQKFSPAALSLLFSLRSPGFEQISLTSPGSEDTPPPPPLPQSNIHEFLAL